ncbi:hypothetical protein RGQ29_010375 [Quercus rubra]|uniref:COPA/B TPR domain-containing protein n=1 Tax=Quercus rubra TaxID=3512 RepID=A0AAN7G298_QUERU|nr:hypothetical protein RGQ29_010375 [Quercus rubra]
MLMEAVIGLRVGSQLDMAEECLKHVRDLSGLLLLYSSLGDAEGITQLASLAKDLDYKFELAIQLGRLEVAKISPYPFALPQATVGLHHPAIPSPGHNSMFYFDVGVVYSDRCIMGQVVAWVWIHCGRWVWIMEIGGFG